MDEQQRLASIESRLLNIENFLAKVYPERPAPAAQPATQPAVQAKVNFVQSAPKSSEPANWLGIVAVICFVFAAAFIIKLAIDSNWLTPVRQVGLAGLFGVGLIVAGLKLVETDREYAAYLPAAGVIVLYLAAFASHRFYSLTSYPMALGFTVMISVVCIWLFFQMKSELYPIIAAIGVYVSPLWMFSPSGEFTLYYYIVCSFAFSSISVWANTRTLSVVAAYLAVICTALIGGMNNDPNVVAMMLLAHGVIFAVGTFLHTQLTGKTMTEDQGMALLPVLLVFYASEYYFLGKTSTVMAPAISIIFAAMLMGLHTMAKAKAETDRLGSVVAVYGFCSIVMFHSFYWVTLPDLVKPWLLVLMLAAFIVLPVSLSVQNPKPEFKLPSVLAGAILVLEFSRLVWRLLVDKDSTFLPVGVCTVAALWSLIVLGREKISKETYQAVLGVTHFLAILICFRLVDGYGTLAVSAVWLFYAAAVFVFAYQRKDNLMARSALMVLALAAVKALLFDASSAPNVVRIFCLIMTGAVLYGAGFLLRRINTW